MKAKHCKICGSGWHYQTFCPFKKKKAIKPESDKYKERKRLTNVKWRKANPPDENGYWYCYLRISDRCPYRLTEETVRREHVIPRVKAPELTFDENNIRPACSYCNGLKGSRTIEQLSEDFPYLKSYL